MAIQETAERRMIAHRLPPVGFWLGLRLMCEASRRGGSMPQAAIDGGYCIDAPCMMPAGACEADVIEVGDELVPVPGQITIERE